MQISGRVQLHLDNAHACYEQDDFECARKTLSLIPTRELTNQEQVLYYKDLAYYEGVDGNYDKAVQAYWKVVELSENKGQRQDALRYIAQLNASLGRFQEAYEALENLLVFMDETPLAMRHLTADALWHGHDIYVIGDWGLVPLVPAQLPFPAEAAAQGLQEGHVLVEFTVTATGTTRDVQVIESSAPVFENPAMEAVHNLRYKPRLVDGKAIASPGVQYRAVFGLKDSE